MAVGSMEKIVFTIDLLKGEGIPEKSEPKAIAIAAVAAAVPFVIALVIFGCYLSNRVTISGQKQAIANYQAKIDKFSEAVQQQKSLENQKNTINGHLSEISFALCRHTQWSPILEAPDTSVSGACRCAVAC